MCLISGILSTCFHDDHFKITCTNRLCWFLDSHARFAGPYDGSLIIWLFFGIHGSYLWVIHNDNFSFCAICYIRICVRLSRLCYRLFTSMSTVVVVPFLLLVYPNCLKDRLLTSMLCAKSMILLSMSRDLLTVWKSLFVSVQSKLFRAAKTIFAFPSVREGTNLAS